VCRPHRNGIRPGDMVSVASLAINLAHNCDWSVFPCQETKAPACPHGFKDAVSDPSAIAKLWRRHPGPLICIATGARSRISVLDIDVKHETALAWWHSNQKRLPSTRTFRSYSGGIHLYFRHAVGVTNTQSRLRLGVDTRGDGGYIIYWFATGLECLDPSPPAPWPKWILYRLLSKASPKSIAREPSRDRSDRAIDGVLRLIATAAEGERNAILHWGACRFGERVRAGLLGADEAERMLVAAAAASGLAEREARTTARSGLQRSR
jgi:hypothetical protein